MIRRILRWLDRHFVVSIILAVILIISGLLFALEVTGVNDNIRANRAHCAQQGGYYFSARDATPICIKRESLIPLK